MQPGGKEFDININKCNLFTYVLNSHIIDILARILCYSICVSIFAGVSRFVTK